MATANTFQCFREVVGQKVIGVFQGSLGNNTAGCKTLVFENGKGLTIASNGSFWTTSEDDIKGAIKDLKMNLENLQQDLQDVLKLMGGD